MINVSFVKSAWSCTQCKATAQGCLAEVQVKISGFKGYGYGSGKRTEVAPAKVVGVRVAGQKCLEFPATAITRNITS